MKKNLTFLNLLIFVFMFYLNGSAQNSRLKPGNDEQRRNFATAKVPVHKLNNSLKIPGSNLLPLTLSGYYIENFEGAVFPPSGWQVIDVLDPTYTWVQSNVAPYSGSNSAFITYTDNQSIDGEDWLILPQFTVASTDSFTFWLQPFFSGYPPDSTFILVSTTNTMISSFTNVLATLSEGNNYPDTTEYWYYSYPLGAFAGQDIYVAIKNKNTWGDGVFIDHVTIGTKPPVNATSVSIDLPKCVPVGTLSPQATFLNDGNSTQSFPVTMTITGGYTSTKNVTSLSAGASQQVTFDPWTTFSPSDETVLIETQLAGDGYNPDDTLAAAIKILEPFTNYGWSSRAQLPTNKFGVATAAINTNDTSYLYSLGGVINFNTIIADGEKYVPYSNSWMTISPMNNAGFMASAASFNNKIYVIGGYNPNLTGIDFNQVYDIASNSWSAGAAMPVGVGDYAFGVYHDSLFYYLGGYGGGDQDLVQIYNPATDTWTNGTNLPVAGAGWRGGISDNKIVITGGYNQFSGLITTTYVGDINPGNPSLITWSAWDDYPQGANTRFGGGASLDAASGLVIFTGGDPSATGNESLDVTFAFDVTTYTWKIGPPKITPANNLCNLTCVVDNDSLYITAIGGIQNSNTDLNVNEWLNLGPYTITTGVHEKGLSNSPVSCFPNPFEASTKISFSLSKAGFVKTVVTDLLGNEISVLSNSNFNAGHHRVEWNASKYAPGIYLCTVFINGEPFSQKLVKY